MTDYGSGVYAGPAIQQIQDLGWTQPTLKLGMVGDSITVRSAAPLRLAFADGGITGAAGFAIRAHSGQNTEGSLDWLESLTHMPDNLIMATGTNDFQNPPAILAQLVRAKNLCAAAGTRLFWVNTYVCRSSQLPATQLHDLRNSGWVNNFIHEEIVPSQIVDWVGALSAAVGRGRALNYYLEDGFHPWLNGGTTPYLHASGTEFFAGVASQLVLPHI